jgi:hypothetical protein
MIPARLLLASALALEGCAIPDPGATVDATCPDRTQFTSVSPFLETGCGTLDCHGAPSRPLRIYGYAGLRLSPGDVPGVNPTTVAEVAANYVAVCGLEPEIMSAVTAKVDTPDALLMIQKPRGETRHKGGTLTVKGDEGDTCETSWLLGSVEATACSTAAAGQER